MTRLTVQELEDTHAISKHYVLELKQTERLKALQMRLGMSSQDLVALIEVIKEDYDIVPDQWAEHNTIDITE